MILTLDISCDEQTINMKCQDLFSLDSKKKLKCHLLRILTWCFKGQEVFEGMLLYSWSNLHTHQLIY